MKIVSVNTFKKLLFLNNCKIAGLDCGTKRIGIALADETKTSVVPCGEILRTERRMDKTSIGKVAKELEKLVRKHNVAGFVVGFPLHESGELTPFCNELVEMMSEIECLPMSRPDGSVQDIICTFWDERYSTAEAKHMVSNISNKRAVVKKYRDSFAACLILKSFINLQSE